MNRFQRWLLRLARVNAVPPGRENDGLVSLGRSGTELDKTWETLQQEFTDTREVWQKNPLARRLVGLITAYVVGDGLALAADDRKLAKWLAEFWNHELNHLGLRQYDWCDELSRAGELFISLHLNPVDGMSYVRALPASCIDKVECAPGDYERELSYHETVGPNDPDYPAGRTWLAPWHPDADKPGPDGRYRPVVLHFAVNRPVGCVRGESDLAPTLLWLHRYARWLEDRVRLNAAVRAFLWIVRVPKDSIPGRKAELARAPEPGQVLVVDRDNEEWQAVAPVLHAHDASSDGRAIRWMVAAGGPGVGLVDFGEADEANLATARAMGEQRSRFMRARQAYFAHLLATVAVTAHNRAVGLGKVRGGLVPLSAVRVAVPDISPDDNSELGASAQQLALALQSVGQLGFAGDRWRRLVLRLVLKFAGETVGDDDVDKILVESARAGAGYQGARRGGAERGAADRGAVPGVRPDGEPDGPGGSGAG